MKKYSCRCCLQYLNALLVIVIVVLMLSFIGYIITDIACAPRPEYSSLPSIESQNTTHRRSDIGKQYFFRMVAMPILQLFDSSFPNNSLA